MLLGCKSTVCAIASEVPLARSAATIVKVFMVVKSRIFYLLLHIGFSYSIGYPQLDSPDHVPEAIAPPAQQEMLVG
jgi:hypothetical protein